MVRLGYVLSSEELGPNELVRAAVRAEEAGFETAWVSDHFHPWIGRQGQSPFVWAVIGGIAQATGRLRVGTGVTCPTIRIHPAIVAQAAATATVMLPGRFFLGVGSGENLNEHILGDRWPPTDVRLEMLEEAVAVIRLLWQGGTHSHHGRHYTVENACLYTLPEQPPPIYVSAFGPKAAGVAARIGDGYVGTAPQAELLEAFAAQGGADKPQLGTMKVCWADDEERACRTAFELWPNLALPGELAQELATVAHFEQAVAMVTADDVCETIPVGPDPERHLASIRQYADAGYDEVYVHQIGPDQEGFCRFYEREVLPRLA
ncbi:MAG TPA: TIGR03557 family F420-dependent LLM class oxidoreductase [Egibacteraceae bacterium]|nr:TIGR03557 family F420-dependent LLM class oxidoreductase [Actinomycetota bacterium]HWB73171.1 TIGR03557 family F420-dependent LLM class oxidoreductase [Egibacteraceae bacterium]